MIEFLRGLVRDVVARRYSFVPLSAPCEEGPDPRPPIEIPPEHLLRRLRCGHFTMRAVKVGAKVKCSFCPATTTVESVRPA